MLPFGTIFNNEAGATPAQLDANFQQTPCLVASARLTAQAAAVPNLLTYAVGGADGTFLILGNVLVTTSVNHSFGLNIGFTDEGGGARVALTLFNILSTISNSIANANGAIPYLGLATHIRAKAGTNIILSTSGTFTNVAYNLEGLIYQLK